MSDPMDLTQSLRQQRILLRQEILRLHVEDSVAWTSCYTLAQGEETVSKLRLDRDIKKSDYDVCREKINACKLEIRLLEEEIKRDWQG